MYGFLSLFIGNFTFEDKFKLPTQYHTTVFSPMFSHYQSMLPETGVPMLPPNTDEENKQKLNDFIMQRTAENYKFHIFSQFMEPLFKSFCKDVTSHSTTDLSASTEKWVKEKCDLPSLRPGNSQNSFRQNS